MQNFKTICAISFDLSHDKKLTSYKHSQTQTYIFGRLLFFNLDNIGINKVNGEIWQLYFDTVSKLYSIKDWESNIATIVKPHGIIFS